MRVRRSSYTTGAPAEHRTLAWMSLCTAFISKRAEHTFSERSQRQTVRPVYRIDLVRFTRVKVMLLGGVNYLGRDNNFWKLTCAGGV